MARAWGPSPRANRGHRGVGPDREGDLLQQRHLADADLEGTLGSAPITSEIPGSRDQNLVNAFGRTVARVSAASGPGRGVSVTSKGVAPDQWPRTEVGVRKIEQLSTA
jgi:hypothetical protein